MRRAKIICTLGPATETEEAIEALIRAGMDVARLNFSHGTHTMYRTVINRVRAASGRAGKTVAILQDLQGPKIRTRKMANDAILLQSGSLVRITTENILGTAERFATQYKLLPQDIKPGDTILLDDGKLSIVCTQLISDTEIEGEVVHGGILRNNKGINLPNAALSVPCLTEKDLRDLHFGAEVGVDAVALSFVRCAEDLRNLRRELALTKSRPLIIAKLEKPQAIDDLEQILEETDGVMVARGDLGVEIPLERVPTVQKSIIKAALRRGKPVIVATQMLESMIVEPRPTRAEASDVANAVLDGADMLMLSAETASGAYPIDAVKTMDRIIAHAESSDLASYWRTDTGLNTHLGQAFQNAVSLAAVRASQELNARAIVMYTTSGGTARLVSDYRPKVPVIAFVPNIQMLRRLCFTWGVEGDVIEKPTETEALVETINNRLIERMNFQHGDTVVVLTKAPLVPNQRTNTMHVHTIRRLKGIGS